MARKILRLRDSTGEVFYSLYGQFETLRDFWTWRRRQNRSEKLYENEARVVELTEEELAQIPEDRIVERILRGRVKG